MMCKSRSRMGFTLIEILVAMVLLSAITTMLAGIFRDITEAWDKADKRNEIDNAARSSLDWLIREISNGMVTSNLHVVLDSNHLETYGSSFQSDALYFVCLNEEPRGSRYRAARQLGFYVVGSTFEYNGEDIEVYNLKFNERSTLDSMSCYDSDNSWWDGDNGHNSTGMENFGEVLAENVTTFEVWLYYDDDGSGQLESEPNFNSKTINDSNLEPAELAAVRFPVMADLYIEMLGRSDAITAHYMKQAGNSEIEDFIKKNAKGYVTRVYFDNRDGYLKSLL